VSGHFTLSGGLLTDLNTDVDASTPQRPVLNRALHSSAALTSSRISCGFSGPLGLGRIQYTFARVLRAQRGVLNAPIY